MNLDTGVQVTQAADSIGIREMTVQALSDKAKGQYERVASSPSQLDPPPANVNFERLGRLRR